MNSRQLIEAETDRFQDILNKAYGRWQKGGEHEDKGMAEFIAALEEPERMATVLGKFNQQVTNGGIQQWIDNGYADAQWPYLPEYAKQFANTPNGAKFANTIRMLGNLLEDNDTDSFSELTADKSEDLRSAIMQKEWDEVDRLLGGTDLDNRRYQLAMQDEVRNGSVKTSQVGDQYKFQITVDLEGGEEEVVYDSTTADDAENGGLYPTEEAADEAGAETEVDWRSLDDDVLERVEEKVLGELADEYTRHSNNDDTFERISRDYYTYDEAWLAELEQYFQKNYPDTFGAKLKKMLAGGVEAVRQGVKTAGSKVRDFGQRVGRAATAAQKAFRGESAKKVVADLLNEK